MVNRIFWLLSIVSILAVSTAMATPGRIKIGVSLPLTGNAATYGTDIKNALLFAHEKLAKNKYEIIIEDDGCTGKGGVTVATKLTSIDKVDFVLGFGCSEVLVAAAPVYEKSKTVVISSGTANPTISKAGDYIYRTYPSDEIPAALLL